MKNKFFNQSIIKTKKLLITLLLIFTTILALPYYHLLLFWYNRFIIDYCKYGCEDINIGTIGDSLATLSFLFLAYSLLQSSRALRMISGECSRNREEMKALQQELVRQRTLHLTQLHEMKEQREELKEHRVNTNDLLREKGTLEVIETLRILTGNLKTVKVQNGNGVKTEVLWRNESKNSLVKANLSLLIQYSLELLAEISRHETGLIKNFADSVIEDNIRRLNGKNFHGQDLSYLDLSGAWLFDSNLDNTNLTSSKLQGAILSATSLNGANMQNTRLTHANLQSANLKNAKGLTIEQLADTASLYEAKLPAYIDIAFLKHHYPQLFAAPPS